jgi:PAS domain S-box-containing protein
MLPSQPNAMMLVQAIVDNTSSVIYVKDLSGRYLLINRRFEELFGIRRDEVLGKTDFDLFPAPLAEAFRRNDEQVGRAGQLLEFEEVAPHSDGPRTYLSIKFPLQNGDGEIAAVGGVSTDITERLRTLRELEQLRHRLALLLESVGEGICGITSGGLIDFANAAVERLLNWPVATLLGEEYSVLWPAGQNGPEADPVRNALQSGLPQHVERTMLVRPDGTQLPVECRANAVFDQGEVAGAVLVFRDLRERLARERIDAELLAAYHVQHYLYPQQAPEIPGFDVAGMTFPSAQVCGDYYDFQPWYGSQWCLALGDVSGHGLGPALQMVETRAVLRAVLRYTDEPCQVLRRMNEILYADMPEGMFVTLFVARLDPRTRTLTYCSAGHPANVFRGKESIECLNCGGYPLGLFPRATYADSCRLELRPKDILVVASDGISEMRSRDQKLFGWERVWSVVAEQRLESAQDIGAALYYSARQFSQGERQHDDVTLIIAKCLAE